MCSTVLQRAAGVSIAAAEEAVVVDVVSVNPFKIMGPRGNLMTGKGKIPSKTIHQVFGAKVYYTA